MDNLTELRLAGKTLHLGDYVVVHYRTGGGGVRGNITRLWSVEHGDTVDQAQVNNGWCFHDWDYIYEHREANREAS